MGRCWHSALRVTEGQAEAHMAAEKWKVATRAPAEERIHKLCSIRPVEHSEEAGSGACSPPLPLHWPLGLCVRWTRSPIAQRRGRGAV